MPSSLHDLSIHLTTSTDLGDHQPNIDRITSMDALLSARDHLLSKQKEDGHWVGDLEGDTILESEYALMQAILGRLDHPMLAKCSASILDRQQADGGWSNYPGGPADPSVSAKAYFTLKLAGHDPNEPHMMRARDCILSLGGAEGVNSFTRFYFAALGQIPYSHIPSVPVEIMLLPDQFPISLYRMSSWTRTIVVPLAIVQAFKPRVCLPPELGIRELFVEPPREGVLPSIARVQGRLFRWENIFRLLDRGLKFYERSLPRNPLRARAIKRAEAWMLERLRESDGVGAIFPPMVYTVLALHSLGYASDSPEMVRAEKVLDDLILDRENRFRIQPCVSPVWDTTWSMLALTDAGLPADHPALCQAADWLLKCEITAPGDWMKLNPSIAPGGWAFEYSNRFYPDLDDTSTALLALKRTARFADRDCQAAIERGLTFELAMQSSDHGWAAFDRDINNPVLEAIPFADHNAMLDPSCPDITARVLEMLGEYGYSRQEPFIASAIDFLLSHQEPEGCWFGRWGVNYIYGTWQALVGLASIGFDMNDPRVLRAADWLLSVQNPDGGWGESCATYVDRRLMGQGVSTPSQTAWSVLGLLAAGLGHSDAARRGIGYLIAHQRDDGSWEETEFTGTGFPKVFYLRYHYYALYFPLQALGKYARHMGWLTEIVSSKSTTTSARIV